MFTANLAGSASSHLRPYDTKRDSSHSRLNLHELDQINELEEEERKEQVQIEKATKHVVSEKKSRIDKCVSLARQR